MAGVVLAAATAGMNIVLGSSSATRSAIMKELGYRFETAKPGIDEKAIRFDDPEELVLALGKAKAKALLEGARGAEFASRGVFLLTGDQVVVWRGKILEKPEDEAECRKFIAGYGEAPPSTVGSCVVTDAASGAQWSSVDVATVHFSPIPSASVDTLIAEGDVMWCAGGLMVEHALVQPHVTRMEGTIDSVMGLCKESATRLLNEAAAAREAAAAK